MTQKLLPLSGRSGRAPPSSAGTYSSAPRPHAISRERSFFPPATTSVEIASDLSRRRNILLLPPSMTSSRDLFRLRVLCEFSILATHAPNARWPYVRAEAPLPNAISTPTSSIATNALLSTTQTSARPPFSKQLFLLLPRLDWNCLPLIRCCFILSRANYFSPSPSPPTRCSILPLVCVSFISC